MVLYELFDSEGSVIESREVIIPIVIPSQVTMRQARLALLGAGILTDVNNTVAGLAGVQGDAARIEWEYSQVVERERPLVNTLSSLLNLSDAQIDELFLQASKL